MNCATVLLDDMVKAGHGAASRCARPTESAPTCSCRRRPTAWPTCWCARWACKPGNRVLLRGPNNPMMAAAWLAVFKAGGICVGTMPLLRAKELIEIVNKARSRTRSATSGWRQN
jgi:2-aminobenzoate-CoA ligase